MYLGCNGGVDGGVLGGGGRVHRRVLRRRRRVHSRVLGADFSDYCLINYD